MERTYSHVQGTSAPENTVNVSSRNPILDNQEFRKLVSQRRTFSWSLTAIMLTVYFGFILALAFIPKVMGTPITEGYPMTWGIPMGFGMLAFTILIVGIYVWRTNTCYDQQIKAIIGSIQQ